MIEKIALALVIVGAVNWLLVGALNFNLVTTLFGSMPILEKIVYVIVGLCGLFLIKLFIPKQGSEM